MPMTVSLTGEKKKKFAKAARELLARKDPTLREIAGMVGLMTAYAPAVEYGGSHIKLLEMNKNEALVKAKGNFDAHMQVSREAAWDILWWLDNLERERRKRVSAPETDIRTPP